MGKLRDKWKKNRELRRHGPDTAYYGGSKEAQDVARGQSKIDVNRAKDTQGKAYEDYGKETEYGRKGEQQAEAERRGAATRTGTSRSDWASNINQLESGAENVLSRRAAELAGRPTLGQATDTALSANQAAAQQRLAQQTGLQNRQARGLAGSMGEGGALAMQQAMASAGAGAADLAAMNQSEQNQLAADLRYKAAVAQNQQDIDTANLGAATRLGATEQALAARQALNAADTSHEGLLQNRALNMLAQRNMMTTGRYGAAADQLGAERQNQQFIEGTIMGVEQAENQRKYEAAQRNNPFQKIVSTVFDPADIRGSGTKGIV